jgi:hypothetical protein
VRVSRRDAGSADVTPFGREAGETEACDGPTSGKNGRIRDRRDHQGVGLACTGENAMGKSGTNVTVPICLTRAGSLVLTELLVLALLLTIRFHGQSGLGGLLPSQPGCVRGERRASQFLPSLNEADGQVFRAFVETPFEIWQLKRRLRRAGRVRPCAGETDASGDSQIVYLLVTGGGDDRSSSGAGLCRHHTQSAI